MVEFKFEAWKLCAYPVSRAETKWCCGFWIYKQPLNNIYLEKDRWYISSAMWLQEEYFINSTCASCSKDSTHKYRISKNRLSQNNFQTPNTPKSTQTRSMVFRLFNEPWIQKRGQSVGRFYKALSNITSSNMIRFKPFTPEFFLHSMQSSITFLGLRVNPNHMPFY